jgi:hypothetical protein
MAVKNPNPAKAHDGNHFPDRLRAPSAGPKENQHPTDGDIGLLPGFIAGPGQMAISIWTTSRADAGIQLTATSGLMDLPG